LITITATNDVPEML